MKLLILFIFLLFSCSKELVVVNGATMGTTYTVKYFGNDQEQISAEIELVLEQVNNSMSTYRPYSELSKINTFKKTSWISISKELEYVIRVSLRLSEMSKGAYDVTLGPLVNIWGFGPEKNVGIPTVKVIGEAKKRVGYKKLDLKDGKLRKKHPELYIDLSSIAKGYGVDRISTLLDKKNINNYLVEIGGELRSKGTKGNRSWSVAILKPTQNGGIDYILKLANHAVATSGDYRNFFMKGDIRYSHTIDSKTGRPIVNDLASVTVVGEADCMDVDAQATMLLAMGFKEGLLLANKQKIAAYFIQRDKDTFVAHKSIRFQELFND